MIYLLDEFPEHPKVLRAGGDAAWLYVCGLAYTNRYLTGGFIPAELIGRLSDRRQPSRLATKLVQVGLWERTEGGFVVHDYDEHNHTAEAKRAARQEKARNAANARWQKRQASFDLTSSEDAPSNAPSIGQASPEDAPRARGPNPQPPTPAVDVDGQLSSSAREPSIDDDSAVLANVDKARRIVADDRLWRRIREKGPVGDPAAWADRAAQNAFTEVLEAAEALGYDAEPDDLAQLVLTREQARR